MQVEGCGLVRRRPIGDFFPYVAVRARFADRPHHVVPHRWFALDAVVLAFKPVIEPANHVLGSGPAGVIGIDQLADPIALLPAMQPRPDHELLISAGIWPAVVLATDEAGD